MPGRESAAQERDVVEFGALGIWVMVDRLGVDGHRGSLEGWEEKHQHLRRKWKGREEMKEEEPGEGMPSPKSLLGRKL